MTTLNTLLHYGLFPLEFNRICWKRNENSASLNLFKNTQKLNTYTLNINW